MSAGAILMVIRCCGKEAPELRIAEVTRSLASSMALSGRPTILNLKSPTLLTSVWTSTETVSRPTVAPVRMVESIV